MPTSENQYVTLLLAANVQAEYHSTACSNQNAMKAIANRLLNWGGQGGAKTRLRGQKSKIVSENRKSIFRSKQMPIAVMIRPNESEKLGRYSGTK